VVLCEGPVEIKLEIWQDFLAHIGKILIFCSLGLKDFPKIFPKKGKGPGRGKEQKIWDGRSMEIRD
jgi:hypothetical protein